MGRTFASIYTFGVPSKTTRGQNPPGNLAAPLTTVRDRRQLGPDPRLPARQAARNLRLWRRRIVAGGATALILPGGSGLALLISGRPDAPLLLAATAIIVIITAALNAAATMYQSRQETLRREIDRTAANELAAALARSIDDAHASAPGLPVARQAEEAARVRASATRIMTDMTPAVLALLGQAPGQPTSTAQIPISAPPSHVHAEQAAAEA